jgi:hypothetical protein
MAFDQRFSKVTKLITALGQRRDKMITRATLDLQFAVQDTAHELDLTLGRWGLLLSSGILWPTEALWVERFHGWR